MKKLLLILLIAFIAVLTINAQTIGANRINKHPLMLKAMEGDTKGHILYATPMVGLSPVTLSVENGLWKTGTSIAPLFAYGFGIGEYSTNAFGDIEVQPYIGINAFVAGGFIPNGTVQGTVQFGGIATIYKWFGIGGGIDALSGKGFLATTLKFDLFTFKKGFGATVIKTWN